VVRSCAAFEPLDDDHPATAAWAEICRLRLGGIGAVYFDGINGNDWRHEQFASAGDVLGTLAAGEQAIVADAVEACGEHVHEKAANELVGGKRHHLVAVGTFNPVVLPLEGDAFLVACDQAVI
jgi:hypothetical protein